MAVSTLDFSLNALNEENVCFELKVFTLSRYKVTKCTGEVFNYIRKLYRVVVVCTKSIPALYMTNLVPRSPNTSEIWVRD